MLIDAPMCAAPTARPPPPYAVKVSKVIWMIQKAPPPMPLCFDSMAQWQEYLVYLHASGETITRRQDLGKHKGPRVVTTVFDRIDHCEDCLIGEKRQLRMQDEGRCILPKDFPTTERTPCSKP